MSTTRETKPGYHLPANKVWRIILTTAIPSILVIALLIMFAYYSDLVKLQKHQIEILEKEAITTRQELKLKLEAQELKVRALTAILKATSKRTNNLEYENNLLKRELHTLKAASRSEEIPNIARRGKFVGVWKLTAYSAGSQTASGARPEAWDTLSIDPAYWHYGEKFYIEGYGLWTAEDRGRKVPGGGVHTPRTVQGRERADLFVNSESEANRIGVRYAKVWLVED